MPKILLTGATGYIGGSILTALLRDAHKETSYAVLIRNPHAADKFRAHGIATHVFSGLDDLQVIEEVASGCDAAINTASASHPESAKALIRGLAKRKQATGTPTFIIHTSGTSILGDHAEGKYAGDRVYSDVTDDIYDFERQHPEEYSQRVTDLAVVDTAGELGVKSYIVIPPTIYGKGTGFFATISQQIPHLTRLAIREGQTIGINEGASIWNHIHAEDMADFYSFLLARILQDDKQVTSGRSGYYFIQDGEHTWGDVSAGIATSLKKQGILATDAIRQESADWVGERLGFGSPQLIRLGFSSNARARDDRARALGWKPKKPANDFARHFDDEVATVVAEFQ
ncbi:putative Long-chain-fatty-acyl-CoA reductase [Rhodotorula taiwanensis]|uniref:Putative Long-chain-fatty-acyl-CoA reductase n=1 Tax=Rhodotorula taiwanensis TaxID=741276 RepID=A0A2S5B0N2_9BASI|nr:putative Long-chain-fatty-acyl-CoA reductase [Rhodotorula taiwanensis]